MRLNHDVDVLGKSVPKIPVRSKLQSAKTEK